MTFFEPMLAHKLRDYKHKIVFPVSVQPKLDGIRGVWDGKTLWTRGGKVMEGVPQIVDELEKRFSNLRLDGEIYDHETHQSEISGIARRKTSASENHLQFVVYDYPVESAFRARMDFLDCLFECNKDAKFVRLLPTFHDVESLAQVRGWRLTFLKQGYEGVMIRDSHSPYVYKRTKFLLKSKPWIQTAATIVGFIEGKGRNVGRLGSFLVRGKHKDGLVWEGKVGSGLDDLTRAYAWKHQEALLGMSIKLEYQEMTKKNHVPLFPHYKGLLVTDSEVSKVINKKEGD